MAEATTILKEVADLYHRGLYLQAYRKSEAIGPLANWTETPALVLAGRLAGNLGGYRLAVSLHHRAWRNDPADAEASYFYAHALFSRGRLIAAQRRARQFAESETASAEIRA